MRRHIPSCPVRRRRHADRRASSRSNLEDHSGTPSLRGWSPSSSGQGQAFPYSWPASNGTGSSLDRSDRGTPSSWWPRTYTSTPAARSPLPFLHAQSDSHASRYTSASPDIQREASFQPSMPVLEPSYSPHPPNPWPSAQRATYDPGMLPRASTASTIYPLDNSSIRGSPASTEVARDSQSRFGSTDDFRLASTPVPLQRYPSAVPNQWDPRGSQGSRSQVLSSATSIPPSAGTLLLNGGALPPIQEAAQPRSYDRMEYPTRGEPMFRRLRPHVQSSPGQGPGYWSSLSQLSLSDHKRPGEPGPSDRGGSNEDHEHPG